ncbi:uberolysin/carnocyclin family circular bacteriocin [Streptomyces sp. NPDC007861]|uniref:uberolysin/carnocyclin family circular bacteriocin n=1 Tax=Streptomyces sp. NPDC007861 TaxID=3154893 RepID=UPI0033D865F3
MQSIIPKKAFAALTVGAISAAGLAMAGFAAFWVAGSLGISASVAGQVVSAIEAGGLALSIVGAMFSGGVISAISATVLYYIKKQGKAFAIA